MAETSPLVGFGGQILGGDGNLSRSLQRVNLDVLCHNLHQAIHDLVNAGTGITNGHFEGGFISRLESRVYISDGVCGATFGCQCRDSCRLLLVWFCIDPVTLTATFAPTPPMLVRLYSN